MASEKEYRMISPGGDVVLIKGMAQFCRDNELSASAMSKVALGTSVKTHKGWRVAPVNFEVGNKVVTEKQKKRIESDLFKLVMES